MSYYGLYGLGMDPIKEKETTLENKKHELFLAEYSVYGETEYTRLKQEQLRKEIRDLENELIREMKEAPLRRQREEEQERIRKQKEEEQERLFKTQRTREQEEKLKQLREKQELEKIARREEQEAKRLLEEQKAQEELQQRREKLAELVQLRALEPLSVKEKTQGYTWVHPKSALFLYRMLEVYIKKEGCEEEKLIWQGVHHTLMNQEEDRANEMLCIYEDEITRKDIQYLLNRYKKLYPDKKDIGRFFKVDMQIGVMEKQLRYDEQTTYCCPPAQYIITVSEDDVIEIEFRNNQELENSIAQEKKQLSYYMSFDKDQIEWEKQRISKMLDKIAEHPKAFYNAEMEATVVKYYAHLQDLLKESVEKKRINMLTASGEKGENNVDYHLRWLGSNYRTVTKDCYRDDKLTILLKKEDFIDEVQELDHILVSKHGVYLIETKYLKGKITVKKNGNWVRTDGGEEEGMLSPVAQVDRHHVLVSEILDGLVAEEHIHDIICIAHDKAIIEGEENSPVPVVKADNLVRFIKTEDAKASDCEYDCEAILQRIESYKVK